MKKVFGVLLITLLMFSCKNDNNVTIKGSYPSGSGEFLKLEMLNIAETQTIDSVKVGSSGKFQMNFKLDNPELILLRNNSGERINMLAFPDDEIELEIPEHSFANGYKVRGSTESEKIKSLVSTVSKTRFQLDSLSVLFDSLENKEGPEADILVSAYTQIYQKQKRHNIRFVVENISSLSSVYALYQRITPEIYVLNTLKDLQYFKIVADSLKVYYPGSTLTTTLVSDVNKRLEEYNNVLTLNELSKKNLVETGLIDLSIQNLEGNEVKLSSLKGKVVLLSFWASWDSDSRKANKSLKSIYSKYHEKGFEIYSVGLENDKNTWRAAINFEEYKWFNVSELSYPYSYAATAYNITSIPANYLIDRDGNIVAKNITGSVLETWLDNLL